MKRLNILFILTSLLFLFVTIERFSQTTKIFLYPHSFLRLHEVIQMGVIILLTLLVPFFFLKELSNNFLLLKSKMGTFLGALFIIGIYFTATGNGLHEMASFIFNTYCNIHRPQGNLCGGLFFNDYYFGNAVYFFGSFLYSIVLILFESIHPSNNWHTNDYIILFINAGVYALTIFAYDAFDTVTVGLIYSLITGVIAWSIFLTRKKPFTSLPYTLYTVSAYSLGVLTSMIVRFHLY